MQTLTSTSFANVARAAKFGRGGSILSARGNAGLPLELIREKAPSVFAEGRHSSRSERFTYIPTSRVLEGLVAEGFVPTEVRQGGSRDEDKRGYTKHLIRLRRQEDVPATPTLGVLWPEVVLINSHDGTSSYQLYAGLFRYICTNGMIAGDSVEGVKIGHRGDIRDQVIEGSFTVLDRAKGLVDEAARFEQIKLSAPEQQVFARAALALRFEDVDAAPVTPAQVIQANRSADQGADLWHTFNRAQENLINGGLRGQTRDPVTGIRRRVTTRAVNGIDGNRDLNRALHTLTTEFAKLKAA